MQTDSTLRIIDYSPRYKADIMRISIEWLVAYDLLEQVDVDMLENPERMTAQGGRVLIAVNDRDEAAGLVMLENHGDSFDLLKFGVSPEFRGHGAGYLLLNEAICIARACGKKRITLCSNHQLEAALHEYERVGFRYIEYEKTNYALSDISMVLEL